MIIWKTYCSQNIRYANFCECLFSNAVLRVVVSLVWLEFPTLSVLVPSTKLYKEIIPCATDTISISTIYRSPKRNEPHWTTKSAIPHIYTVSNKCTCLTTVKCRLSTHGEQDAIRALSFDDFSYKLRRDGQEVNWVGLLGAHLIRLNRSYVWVHEHRLQILLLQHMHRVN